MCYSPRPVVSFSTVLLLRPAWPQTCGFSLVLLILENWTLCGDQILGREDACRQASYREWYVSIMSLCYKNHLWLRGLENVSILCPYHGKYSVYFQYCIKFFHLWIKSFSACPTKLSAFYGCYVCKNTVLYWCNSLSVVVPDIAAFCKAVTSDFHKAIIWLQVFKFGMVWKSIASQ